MGLSRDRLVTRGSLVLRVSAGRLVLFCLPLLVTTLFAVLTTGSDVPALLRLLGLGGAIGLPFLWWALGHRVEVVGETFCHHMPLVRTRQVPLPAIELVDIRPPDRRWPMRSYVVTLATRQGEYVAFETANFDPRAVRAFLASLLDRAPNASFTGRAEEFLARGL